MRKAKYKSIINFLFFIICLSVVFSSVTWLFRGNGEESRMDVVGFKNQSNIDVVLYGGSTLLRYYSPLDAWQQSGIVSYNYATSAARVDIVKEYVEDSRKTNDALLHVIDVRTLAMVSSNVYEPSLRNWSDSLPVFSPIRWKGISSFLFTKNWKGIDVPSYFFDIIKYHSNTSSLANADQWRYLNRSDIDNIDKGYSPRANVVPFDTPPTSDERGELTPLQEKYLDDLLNYCDNKNLNVLFIVCPYYISESDWKVFNTCGDIIQSRGYKFVNFNNHYEDIGLEFNTDFSDVNHVNYLGSLKYTEYLTNYMTSNFDIPDRRGDSTYASWDNAYNAFQAVKTELHQNTTDVITAQNEALSIGENLHNIDDLKLWLQSIKNNNFSVIINKNASLTVSEDNYSFLQFADEYGIDLAEPYHIGLWNAQKKLFSANENRTVEKQIGVNGGRGQDQCIITAGDTPEIKIGGIDYYKPGASMQILIYDNNYHKIVDNICITATDEGTLNMHR